jgi:methionyl-tRNA formyltransferase
MKIVIAGYGQMFSSLVLGTLESGHEVVGVVNYDNIKYNSAILLLKNIFAPGSEHSFIKSLKLNDIKVRSVNSEKFKKEILKLNPDIILVGSWSEKFRKETILLPKLASINCHPSLLPKYRGPNPYARAIMNCETESGITLHLMDENYDSGPILLQRRVNISETETGETLKNKCCAEARIAVGELLAQMAEEIIIPTNQNEKEAGYYPQVSAADVLINFKNTAGKIDCQVRGLQPWQSSYIPYKNLFFRVKNVEILENNTKFTGAGVIVEKGKNSLSILSGDGKMLKFGNIALYGGVRPLFTNFYLDNFVQTGDTAL